MSINLKNRKLTKFTIGSYFSVFEDLFLLYMIIILKILLS